MSNQHRTIPTSVSSPNDKLLSKRELCEKLGLPSTRIIDEMMRRRRIPFIKMGHRTVRFDLSRVITALGRMEVMAVGDRNSPSMSESPCPSIAPINNRQQVLTNLPHSNSRDGRM